MYPDVFWCILRKYCILAYPDVFWNVFSYFVVCDRDTLCFMYCDVSWCILSVSDAEDEIHGGLIGAPPHPSLPPDLQTDSGYIYTSCSRTYPAPLKHVSRISATYLNGCAKIHTWSSYPTCILHVSCMYPACILHVSYRLCQDTHLSLVSCMSCMYPHVSDMLREDTFFEHVSRMYPACILHVSDTLSQDTSRYIRIHQDTSRYIRILY